MIGRSAFKGDQHLVSADPEKVANPVKLQNLGEK